MAKPVVPAPVISIAGLNEDEVRKVMGEPSERTERDGRKIWNYRGVGCRVEVTFFRDVTRGTYAALAHRIVRTGVADGDASVSCDKDARRVAR